MNNLKSIFAVIIFAAFALTSCQKENLTELTPSTPMLSDTNERGLPAEGINRVFDAPQTQATVASFQQSANSRNRGYKEIGCGSDYKGCTKGQGNSLDYRHYPDNVDALGAKFDGEDEYFYFEVTETPEAIVTFDLALTGLTVDLDLFVFTLDSRNILSETKGMSINSHTTEERLSLTGLNPGIYIVAVDAYKKGLAGHYNLSIECSAVSANPPSIAPISVNKVAFGFNGQKLGTYQQMTTNTWKEISADPNGNSFDFVETHRDEWSVYLTDESRNVNIQLDLNRKIVSYSDAETPIRDQFEILNSWDKMNGYLTSIVTYGDGNETLGYFTQVADSKDWKESKIEENGPSFDFVETYRDEWSVYLRDDSRGVNIQLDMHTDKVEYSDDQNNKGTIYLIENAE